MPLEARQEMPGAAVIEWLLLHVVAEHQLGRVRVEVELANQVRFLPPARVMAQEHDRHDGRHETLPVLFNDFPDLRLFVRGVLPLEVPRDVREHVYVLAHVASSGRATMRAVRYLASTWGLGLPFASVGRTREPQPVGTGEDALAAA